MKIIAPILLLIKLVCIAIDPIHWVFRPISMYQTQRYWYLGNIFVGLLVAVSVLLLMKQYRSVDAKLEIDQSRAFERFIRMAAAILGLTFLLGMLFLTPIQHGAWHLALAILAMFGYSIYLLWVGIEYQDRPIKTIAVAMLVLCIVPAFHLPLFGLVENILIICLMAGFMRFYYHTLEKDIAENDKVLARTRKKRSHRQVVTRYLSVDD